jgi:glutamate-ammonia-ligase adenylyltransferase
MPLSSQLQQQWQTVCERLPESLPASSLSEQAKSVLTFSDFVQESITANLTGWRSLRLTAAGGRVAAVCRLATNRARGVADEATLMRERVCSAVG